MADHEHHVNLLGLDGRVVVVSGAGGGGIGTTVTTMTARAGATVIAVSRSKENLDEHIAPTSDIPILSEYATKCVSQANSQASRRWRTGFLEAFLTGTYLAGPPVDPALTAVLYQTRQQAGVDGAYRSEEAVDCEQCGSKQVTSSNEIVLGWPPESSVFQLANAQWLHLGCETEGWTILPRPAESGQVAGA